MLHLHRLSCMQLLNSHMQPNEYRVDFVLFYTSIYMCLHVMSCMQLLIYLHKLANVHICIFLQYHAILWFW